MKLKIKPYYRNNLCVIDTDEPFIQTFDCEDTYNNYFCFKARFNLYSIDEEYEEKDIVATVEGCFFRYNRISEYNIDIIDIADTISRDTYDAIITLANNNLFTEVDIEYMPLVCYLSRLYVYPKYRDNGIATYIYKNLQEIFGYITSDLTSIFITLPCPQEPNSDGTWKNIRDDIMFEKMTRLLNKHEFKSVGNGFYYKLYT